MKSGVRDPTYFFFFLCSFIRERTSLSSFVQPLSTGIIRYNNGRYKSLDKERVLYLFIYLHLFIYLSIYLFIVGSQIMQALCFVFREVWDDQKSCSKASVPTTLLSLKKKKENKINPIELHRCRFCALFFTGEDDWLILFFSKTNSRNTGSFLHEQFQL